MSDHEHDWIFSRIVCACGWMHTECACGELAEPCAARDITYVSAEVWDDINSEP
jgi:hypothetical protein